MFFRLKKSVERAYLQIVENKRDDGAVSQSVIATLGRGDELAPPAPSRRPSKAHPPQADITVGNLEIWFADEVLKMLEKMLGLRKKTNLAATAMLHWLFPALLMITAICVFVPFAPLMPGEGLDESWRFGINQAVAQGLAFGRDVIFTFGPYASVYTKTYHPATDGLMVWSSLFLGGLFGLAVVVNFKESRWYLQLLLLFSLAGVMYLRDPLLFYYPLLVGVYIFRATMSRSGNNMSATYWHPLLIALMSPLGLLPLVKGSTLFICVAVIALSFFLLGLKRDWKGLAIVCISPLTSLCFFWGFSGQRLNDLPFYFTSMLSLISGYSEAMSIPGNTWEIVSYVIAAAILLLVILREVEARSFDKAILFLLFFVVLFTALKGGFVRHDGHAVISGTTILLVGLLVSSIRNDGRTLFALFLTFLVWGYIDSNYIKTDSHKLLVNIISTYESAWTGLKLRATERGFLTSEFKKATASLRIKSGFPNLVGATDIYSYDQSYLISSENTWSPRPGLQSYSAYTPALIELNKEHLLNDGPPDNLIFKVQPTDGRMPSLEDGASWPVMFSHYEPTRKENDFLFLRKHKTSGDFSRPITPKERHFFGQVVELPSSGAPIFTKIRFAESLLGKLASTLLKPGQLEISVNMEDGASRNYRLIAGMTQTGFLLSPLIENTKEFALLYGGIEYLKSKKVKSFSVESKSESPLWEPDYEVEFIALDLQPRREALRLYGVAQPVLVESEGEIVNAKRCHGSIDVVNGAFPAPSSFNGTSLLSVQGWLAKENNELPGAVYLVLSEIDGSRRYFIRSRSTLRPDVGAAFKNNQLDASGYDATADTATLKGQFSLGLAYEEHGVFKLCPEFNIKAEFNAR